MSLVLRRSLQRLVTTSACFLGELLRPVEPATCQASKEKDINFEGHLNLLFLLWKPKERLGESEKAFCRRTLEESFEGICEMRKGKSILIKRRASKKEQHEGQNAVSIFLYLQAAKSGCITLDRSEATRHMGTKPVHCADSKRSKQ